MFQGVAPEVADFVWQVTFTDQQEKPIGKNY